MATLILSAFQLQRYQFQPAEWMNSTRFDIVAKVPAGATREQLSEMERNLLTTRFRMAAHYEAKDLPGYRLVVGKDGPRIKDSVDDPPSYTPPAPPKTMRWDAEGFPILPEGKETVLWILNGKVANRWRKITIPELANYFADQLNGPVVDATNLPGKYDIVLRFVSRPAPLPGTPLERGPDVKSSSRHWSQRLILKRPYNRNSA